MDKRDFLDLSNANIKLAINAKELDNKLDGLKWITYNYKEKPKEEINKLKQAINIIKEDTKNKTLVTDYQFISVI